MLFTKQIYANIVVVYDLPISFAKRIKGLKENAALVYLYTFQKNMKIIKDIYHLLVLYNVLKFYLFLINWA